MSGSGVCELLFFVSVNFGQSKTFDGFEICLGLGLLRYSFVRHSLALGSDLLTYFGDLLRRIVKTYCPRAYGDFEQTLRLILEFRSGRTVLFESNLLILMS